MTDKDSILGGCEILCLTGDLTTCSLPVEEQKKCKQRLQYQAGAREVVKWIIERYYAEPEDETFLGGIFIPDCDAEWQSKLIELEVQSET